MSRQIFRDIEEALARQVRRITFHQDRTVSRTVLQDTFDPFTGELVQMPVEPSFYDSSADANNIQYPHFFIRLLKTREDRFSGREVSSYGQEFCKQPDETSPKAYEIVFGESDGVINLVGNQFQTGSFQISKVQPGYLLRTLNGNNKGTYKISSVTISNVGQHIITVSNDLVSDLPATLFDVATRTLVFTSPVDLNTVKIGDNFVDFAAVSFPITAINISNASIVLGGVDTPDLSEDSKISRSPNAFPVTDVTPVRFVVLDPSKPILVASNYGTIQAYSSFSGVNAQVPIDSYYLIRIDSKERDTHIDVLNRVWEEFNPPRTGLPVIVRSAESAETLLSVDVTSGGSSTINVSSNADFNLNDPIYIFDDVSPTKSDSDVYERPFSTKVIGKVSTNQLVLADTVPDTYKVSNKTRIVSNAEFKLLMFNFVDHNTRDVEGAQYWIHEFTFWVQMWVDRNEAPEITSVIQDISTPIEDIDRNIVLVEDP